MAKKDEKVIKKNEKTAYLGLNFKELGLKQATIYKEDFKIPSNIQSLISKYPELKDFERYFVKFNIKEKEKITALFKKFRTKNEIVKFNKLKTIYLEIAKKGIK